MVLEMCNRIYSRVPLQDFIGRNTELDFVIRHSVQGSQANKLLVLAPPTSGLSELLRQVFDILFLSQEEIMPLYFSFSHAQKQARKTAENFLVTLLWQSSAFRRHDPGMLCVSPTKEEVKKLLSAQDFVWMDFIDGESSTESYLQAVFNLPMRFLSSGFKPFLIFDDAHIISEMEEPFQQLFCQLIENFRFPYVLAGRRRALLSLFGLCSPFLTLRLNPLKEEDARELIEKLSKEKNVKVNEQTADLIREQLQANPYLIGVLFEEASKMGFNLDSYRQVEMVINEMIFSGQVGRYLKRLFDDILPDKLVQREVIGLLHETAQSENKRLPFSVWERKLKSYNLQAHDILQRLYIHEIVQIAGADVEVSEDNALLYDYVKARYRLEILNEPRALVIGENLLSALKRAPRMMARFYRKSTSLDLKALLSAFNFQEVPVKFLDYGVFRTEIENGENITLPQIVYVAETTAFYPSIGQFIERGFSYTALGFKESGEEVGWLVAQLDLASEVTKSVAEFWCDRLEIVAFICGFQDFRIWLVTPNGFTEEALQLLKERAVYSSNFQQIQFLAETVNVSGVFAQKTNHNEYEMVLPMGEDTELIAAYAAEEIARRAGFSPKSINKIKTALIEACINASEHSHSPDGKIHQKFKLEDDKLIITISNRGIRMPLEELKNQQSEGRRGWGLKLIRGLMDDIKFMQTDDGVKIVMVKNKD
ncbi:MAG: ATP-binding protein [Pyrinomonadaceae bacterium]|nr:ATP-binding protein [Pyrinomonadaceae bacterium]MCX7638961.1 ATP-binding protein [Pyrinomonadaceae bacterium]MDW8304902.1 ATP-binding protein [Acidobacteriota bacterium]